MTLTRPAAVADSERRKSKGGGMMRGRARGRGGYTEDPPWGRGWSDFANPDIYVNKCCVNGFGRLTSSEVLELKKGINGRG